MKFSKTYILYPDNRVLERAIASSLGMLGEELAEAATPDTKVTAADIFRYTRGNYEQRSFSSNILDSVREALEALRLLQSAVHREQPSTRQAARVRSWDEFVGSVRPLFETLKKNVKPKETIWSACSGC